ncbi:hypothetical protein ACFLYR_05550 [Chloroflexota bacterium]
MVYGAYLAASDTDVANACKRFSPLANLSKSITPRNSAYVPNEVSIQFP